MQGQPVLVDATTDCNYFFEWRTSIMCIGTKEPSDSIPCFTVDTDTGDLYDLSPLITHRNWLILDTDSSSTFALSICEALRANTCGRNSNAGACLVSGDQPISLGMGARPQLVDGTLTIQYSMVRKCISKRLQAAPTLSSPPPLLDTTFNRGPIAVSRA